MWQCRGMQDLELLPVDGDGLVRVRVLALEVGAGAPVAQVVAARLDGQVVLPPPLAVGLARAAAPTAAAAPGPATATAAAVATGLAAARGAGGRRGAPWGGGRRWGEREAALARRERRRRRACGVGGGDGVGGVGGGDFGGSHGEKREGQPDRERQTEGRPRGDVGDKI
jgi:hypothetical protein